VNALSVREAEWHAQRREGIGASDVPAIAGVSTFATPVDVWMSKVGMVEPNAETPLTRWGHLLEPVIADEFTVQTGVKVRRLSRAVKYRDWPILFAHLDRTAGDAILEVKTSMSPKGWGETGSADVPDAVALQVQAQLACAGKETAYVAALIGYRDFRVYTIPRDREMFDDLILPLLREFWQLVETNTPPEPDGSDGYSSFVRRLHPRDAGDERAATPEEQLLGSALVVARTEREKAEAREKELIQRLQVAMKETGRLDGPGWSATWRTSKDRVSTHWESLAQVYQRTTNSLVRALRVHEPDVSLEGIDVSTDEGLATVHESLRSIYTETKPGARPFLLKVTEGE
jgi:putative phage-type endonuclease